MFFPSYSITFYTILYNAKIIIVTGNKKEIYHRLEAKRKQTLRKRRNTQEYCSGKEHYRPKCKQFHKTTNKIRKTRRNCRTERCSRPNQFYRKPAKKRGKILQKMAFNTETTTQEWMDFLHIMK